MLNFFQLAFVNAGGGQSPWAKGLLPPLKTIASLLLVSIGIALCGWMWTGVLTAVTLGKVVAAVSMVSVLNCLFARDIFTFSFATRNLLPKAFDHGRDNSTDIVALIEHLRVELNIHFRKEYGGAHKDLPPLRILTFTEPHALKVFSVGAAPENAAIILSTGVFNYAQTGMSQREIAALIQMELVKIYFRRGPASAITSIATNLLTTAELLTYQGAWPLFLGSFSYVLKILSGPLHFFMLLHLALERNHTYHAAEIVALKMARGYDLMKAYDKKVDAFLTHKPTPIESEEIRRRYERPPSESRYAWVRRLVDWIRDNEYPTDCQDTSVVWGSLPWSFLTILIRELGFWFNELFSKEPRGTNLGKYIRGLVKGNRPNGEEITLNTVRTGEKWHIKQADWAKNEVLFNEMPAETRYFPISPRYKGERKRGARTLISSEDGKIIGHSQTFTVYRCFKPHKKQKEEIEVVIKPAGTCTSSIPRARG